MIISLKQIGQAIDSLRLRERIIVFLIFIFLIFIIWYFGFWTDLAQRRSALNENTKKTQKELTVLKASLESIKRAAREKASLKYTICGTNMVPEEMIKVLQEIIAAQHDLVLLELKSLPEIPLETAKPSAKISEKSPIKNAQLYRHGIYIRLYGDFFSILNYLQNVEKLKWCLYWDKIDYQVINYPLAQVTLGLHTVSDKEGWLYI